MAITATSASYDKQVSGNAKLDASENAKLHIAVFSYTNAGTAGQGVISMGKLPHGKLRVFPQLSRLEVSENGSDESFVNGATIDLGYAAYSEPDGDAVIADGDYWIDGFNPAATHEQRFALPAGGGSSDVGMSKVFETSDGLSVTATIAVQNMEIGAKIRVEIAYSKA